MSSLSSASIGPERGHTGFVVALRRGTRRIVSLVVAVSFTVSVVVASTSGVAGADSPSASVCGSLHQGSSRGSLRITTDPVGTTTLGPGQTVRVTTTWETSDWARPDLHKVLHCVLIDGEIASDLSHQEKPTTNDGTFSYAFTVPASAQRVCDRARLSARPAPGQELVVQKSNTVCFDVAQAGVTAVSAPPPGPSPLPTGTPALEPAATVAGEPSLTVVPEEPGPTDLVDPAAMPMLPRTGGEVLLLMVAAAICTALGVPLLFLRGGGHRTAEEG